MNNLIQALKHKSNKKYIYTFVAILAIKAIKILHRRHHYNIRQENIQLVRIAKRAQIANDCYSFIRNHSGEFQFDGKEEILNSNIEQLHKLYATKKATITQVLLTYIERTVNHGIQNAWIMHVLFEDAYKEAKRQEALPDNDPERHLPLFGIPISIKDFISYKGADTTAGLTTRCFNPAPHDGYEVIAIKRAGGIVFVKTSVPQLGMSMETNNFIVGRALNPYDNTRTTGGSSGGEAALLAKKCALIGIGSDTAGSLRNPASFCGVASYKPSSVRYPKARRHLELVYVQSGLSNFKSISGPMGRYMDDLITMMEVQLAHFPVPSPVADPYFKQRPLNMAGVPKKLKIGVIESFQFVPASLACRRAVRTAAQALQDQGHEIIAVDLDQLIFYQALLLSYSILLADSDITGYTVQLKGEHFIQEYKSFVQGSKVPKPIIRILLTLFNMLGKTREALLLKALSKKWSAAEFLEFSGQQFEFQHKLYELWESWGIDALLTPVTAGVAYKHGQSQNGTLAVSYLMIWSFFDYNAGVVPITKVNADEQYYESEWKDKLDQTLNECMNGSVGLPIGVQVITKPFDDEICLRTMKLIEQGVNFQNTL